MTDVESVLGAFKMLTRAIIVKPGPVCPVCGVMRTSGMPSCCVRGGAWFQKCGDAGDARFEHSWTDGIQACKGNVT